MNTKRIIKELRSGNLVLMPTDTVYGIMADATNPRAVEEVFVCKQRDRNKALILLVSNTEMLREYAAGLSLLEEELIAKYLPGELTILLPKGPKVLDSVSSNNLVGIRIPRQAELIEIITTLGCPLAPTSANLAGQNVINSPAELDPRLAAHISHIVDKGILPEREPSSIIQVENERIRIIRSGKVARQILREYPNYIAS